jgi:type VI secretion system protein ImpH
MHDTFRIRIEVKNLAEFESFLPSGEHFHQLADAVLFYVGSTYIYDVKIGIPEHETRPMRLGSFGRLGWTSWTAGRKSEMPKAVRWDCRFHPAEMTER